MTVAVVLSIISLIFSLLAFCAVLALSKRITRAYPVDEEELLTLLRRVNQVTRSQAQLYRYVEALDDHLGANAHRVLSARVSRSDRSVRD